uniref:Cation-transporting P-type ATPase N-terminal domain-containing protein n=1 Tax=Compsopogon caeruleus TaxID=31354 RepID=A0A7S1TAN1_9RHOD|mmetsp:Transcript_14672/g.29872  ORF Transcript_14672/g.29872 Transcript_14672/m.29872 type:complete len:1159 (+) Transcript_14672:119-3595(+)
MTLGELDTGGQQPRKLSHNELEMARQYSETKERVNDALEAKHAGRDAPNADDLKKELEMWEHRVPLEELCKKLNTTVEAGLSSPEHKARLERDGPNVLTPPKVTPWYLKLLAQYLNFFAILLQIAGVLCFVGYALNPSSQDNLYLGVVLFVVVSITAVFSFLQEYKSEKTMEKFKNFLPPQTLVKRDGKVIQAEASTLVVGDVIEVNLGDKIPADIRVVEASKFKVDNSSLTGESEPQSRIPDCTDENPLETKNLAFFGTSAVDGTATGIVVSTGDRTVFGRIAGLAAGSSTEVTTLQREIHHFIIIISAIAITLGVVFFIIGFVKGTPPINNLVFCIGIIVANVPEGLLATVTVSLTSTARRMASRNVLVKKLESVETLGSTTTICSDKTGTLTQNRMTIVHVSYDQEIFTARTATTDATYDMNHPCMKALFFAACNCAKAVFDPKDMEDFPNKPIDERKVNGDASEAGILKFCAKIEDVMAIRAANPNAGGIPFNSTNKFMVTVHKDPNNPGFKRMIMKGAPERVLEKCTKLMTARGLKDLGPVELEAINTNLATLMNNGERVLGFAQVALPNPPYGDDFQFDGDNPDFPLDDLTFIGLMALLDPPRESVPHAVKTCQTAGIQVIMVTGDHPATAKSIAKQVNIIRDPTAEDIARERGISVDEVDRSEVKAIVVPGSQIKDLEQDDWDRVLAHEQIVFARTSPQQKLVIVENCQRLDKIVAVTGDGVNDSPALKKANIGVAMGIAGSDVSKEAADMILLDDNFSSIVSGVEEGRLIFDNLKKSIAYTLSSNIPEITPFLTFIVISIPQPLTTILILLIDLGTDMLPAISLAYERAESDIMLRPPRDAKRDHLVNERLISFSYFQIGVFQAVAGFFTYFVVFNDYGMAPSLLPQADAQSYFAAIQPKDERWLVTRRDGVGKPSYSRSWYDTEVGDFTDRMIDVVNFQDLSKKPVNGTTGNSEFRKMVKIIGQTYQIPPCEAFRCGRGRVNDFTCFEPNSTTTIDLFGINTGEPNTQVVDVINRTEPNQGCFELWSHSQQREVLRRSQGAFFVSIIIVQWADLVICKTRILSIFNQGMRNWVLNIGLVEETLLAIVLSYVPPISNGLKTAPLRFVHWLPALPFSLMILLYDELRKAIMRRGLKTGKGFGAWLYRFTYW